MSLENEMKKRLQQDRQRQGLPVNFASKQFNPNRIEIGEPAPPKPMGSVFDLLGSTVYNFLDSATMGTVDLLADTDYDMEKWNEMDTMTKTGMAIGQGLGFFVPMGLIGKGTQALVKGSKYATASKVKKVADVAAKQMASDGLKFTAKSKPVNKILEDVLSSKRSQKFLRDYQVSDEAINKGSKLFRVELGEGIVKSFGNKIDKDQAYKVADDMIKGLREGGLHKNTIEGVIYNTFGKNLDAGIKKSLLSYGARTAENLVNFTMYNVGTGIIQEIGNRGDYKYWESLASTLPMTLAFSTLTPAIDAIAKGGKGISITQDAKRLAGILTKSKNYSKLDKESSNFLLQLWGRHQASFSGLDLKSILNKKDYMKGTKKLTVSDLINGTVPDKLAQKLLTELNTVGRKQLTKAFRQESAKDLWGSFPRMFLDGMIFSGINMADSGKIIGRIGTEDFVANLIIGGIMAKKHRPLQGDVGAPRFRYNNDFEDQLNLFESFGLDTNNLRALVDNYDILRFSKTRARSFLQNDEIKEVVRILDEAYSDDVKNREEIYTDSISEISSGQNSTLRTSYNEVYRTVKLMGAEGFIPNMPEINWSKFTPKEIRELNNRLSKVKIGEEGGKDILLENNVLKLQVKALKSGAENVYNKHLEVALRMAGALGIDPAQKGKDGYTFFTANSDLPKEGTQINEYNRTINWLAQNSKGKVNISKDSNTIANIENPEQVAPIIKTIIENAKKELSEEHYGFEKEIPWIDNHITKEIMEVRQFEDFEAMGNFNQLENLKIKEMGNQYVTLETAIRQMGLIVEGDKAYERFVDGFEIVKDSEPVKEQDAEYIETMGILSLVNDVMSVGRQKVNATNNKTKIEFTQAKDFADQFKELFPGLLRNIDNVKAQDSLKNFILRQKYQNIPISTSQFTIVNKIVSDNAFSLDNFPNLENAFALVESHFTKMKGLRGKDLRNDDEYKATIVNVKALYEELSGMGSIIKISDENFMSPNKDGYIYSTDSDGLKIRVDETIDYVQQFNDLGRYTSAYFAESFIEGIVTSRQLNENISKQAEPLLDNMLTSINEIVRLGVGEEQLTSIRADIDSLLTLDIHKDTETELNKMKSELDLFGVLEKEQRLSVADTIERLERMPSESLWSGRTPEETLRKLSEREVQNRNDIAEVLNTLVFYGTSGSTRAKALKAYDKLRETLNEHITDSSPNENLLELLKKYNKTGRYKDFKNYLKNLQLTLNNVYSNTDMKNQDEGYRRTIDEILGKLHEGTSNVNINNLARTYRVLLDPETGNFDSKIMTDISFNVEQLRLNPENKQAENNLFRSFDKIKDAMMGSKEMKNKNDFLEKELSPALNALVSSTSANVLTYKDGAFVFKSKTKIHTPTDTFISKMDEAGIYLNELESSAISQGRYTTANEIKNDNGDDLDTQLRTKTMLVAPFINSDINKAISQGHQIEAIQDSPLGGNYVRVGISDYKNIIFNANNKGKTNLHSKFTEWYNNKLSKVNEDGSENLKNLFTDIINIKNPESLGYGQIQAMIRSMYFDTINTALFNDVLSFKGGDIDARYKQRLKYLKYVHVIEGAQTSKINKSLLNYLQKTYKDNNVMDKYVKGIDNLNNRGDKSGKLGVAIINDEGFKTDFFSNKERVVKAIDNIINQLKSDKNKSDVIAQWKSLKKRVNAKEDSEGKEFASLGTDKSVVSMFNGIAFVGDDLGAITMGLRGRDIDNISQGIKPVVRHNNFDYDNMGAQDASTLVMKTLFVHDPEIARAMKSYNSKNQDQYVDIVSFDSAAKTFSGNSIRSMKGDKDFDSGNVEKGFQSILDNNLKGNEFYIDIEDVGINYPTKDVHDATLTASLYSSMNSSKALNKWLGYRDDNDGTGKFIADVYKPLDAFGNNKLNSLVASMIGSMNERGFNLDDPSLSTLNKLFNIGLDANSPLVKYDVLRMVKTNLIDKLKSPKTKYGTVSPLIPDFRTGNKNIKYLDMPLYEKVNGKEMQTKYGGLTSSYQMMTRIADVNSISFIAENQKTGRDIVVSKKDNYSALKDSDKFNDSWKNDLYEKLNNVDNITYKNVFDLLSHIKNTDIKGTKIEVPNGITLKLKKATIKAIKDNKLDIGVSALRIPKQSSSDFVINRVQGYLDEGQGNLVAVNAFELATKHQGDFDVDKLFYYFNTPSEVLKDLGDNSGNVLDPKPLKSDKFYEVDFFQQGLGLNGNQLKNNKAGVSETDGIGLHTQNLAKAQMLLGRSVRLLSTLKNLSLNKFKIGDKELELNVEVDQLNSSLISASVDVHKGIADFILSKNNSIDDIYKWLLFGDGAGDIFPKRAKGGIFKGELTATQKDMVIESLNTVGRLQRAFSGVYDENGARSPEIAEIKSIYDDVSKFYLNPTKYLFKKLLFKEFAQARRQKRDANYSGIIETFFPNDTKKFDDLRKIMKAIDDPENISNIPVDIIENLSSGVTGKVEILGGDKNIKKAFDNSPAGVLVQEMANRDFGEVNVSKRTINEFGTSVDRMMDNMAFLRSMKGVQGSSESGIKGIVENAFDIVSNDKKDPLYPFRNKLKDTQEASLLYNALELKIDANERLIQRLSKDKYSDNDYLEDLKFKHLLMQSTRDHLVKKIDEDILKDATQPKKVIKGKDIFNPRTNENNMYVYKVEQGKDATSLYHLKEYEILPPGASTRAWDDNFVVLDKPLITKSLENDYMDGESWMNVIPRHSELLRTDYAEDYTSLLQGVENLRKVYKKKAFDTSQSAKERKAYKDAIYEESGMELRNMISKFFEDRLSPKEFQEGSKEYNNRLKLIVNAMLAPRAVFGMQIKGQGQEVKPAFVQDNRFAKAVLEHLLDSGGEKSQMAKDIVFHQSEVFKTKKYNKKLTAETKHYIRHTDDVANYFGSEFSYDNFIGTSLAKDIVYSGLPVPATLMERLRHNYPDMIKTDVRTKWVNNEMVGEIVSASNLKNNVTNTEMSNSHFATRFNDKNNRCK